MFKPISRHPVLLCCMCGLISLSSCTRPAREGVAGPTASTLLSGTDRPVALIGNQRVMLSDLIPGLCEAAGGEIMEEVILDAVLPGECRRAGVEVNEEARTAERNLLASALSRGSGVPASEAERLIIDLRRRRNLGDARFAALLDRSARLRALVRARNADELAISTDDLQTAYALKHGRRADVRLILVATEVDAQGALKRLESESFDAVARAMSIDPSAADGGRIAPVNPADPAFPSTVRRAIETMSPNQVSRPLVVTWNAGGGGSAGGGGASGCAIVKLERWLDAEIDVTLEQARAGLERDIAIARERALMDRLAARLLAQSGVSILDPDIGRSWDRRRGE